MTSRSIERARPRLGIRARILLGYVALLAAALVISALVTRQILHARLDRDIDAALGQEIEELRQLVGGINPVSGEPFGDDVEAIFATFLSRSVPADDEAFYTMIDGRPSLHSFEAPPELLQDDDLIARWAATETPQVTTSNTSLGQVRWLAVPVTSDGDVAGTFVVTFFPAAQRDAINQNLRILGATGLIVLAASALVAWTVAGRIVRPVRDLTDTARVISETDLSARIPVEGHDELSELGRTFNDMLDRLARGFEQQRHFLDDVAHELRTPITIVHGHLELLGDDPDEREETVAIITDELDRMNRYVTDLLVLAKAERPDFLRLAPIDLGEFILSTSRMLTPLADRRWTLDDAPPPGDTIVEADAVRLAQALVNLASNAVDHTTSSDTIGIGAAVDPYHPDRARSFRVWIRDTGPGVDPSIASSLFQRHERGAASRGIRPEGMGIGLSIVDAIARAHGGRAHVDLDYSDGARFELVLPVAGDGADHAIAGPMLELAGATAPPSREDTDS